MHPFCISTFRSSFSHSPSRQLRLSDVTKVCSGTQWHMTFPVLPEHTTHTHTMTMMQGLEGAEGTQLQNLYMV